jgi:asparagine synthase (glutamine-hydrolysing)
MAEVLRHRGPDDDGQKSAPSRAAALGFRRLSIIDLEGGNQPMTSEDGKVLLVFNGEIYNFRELRDRLEKAGHTFASRCDAEVVVHLYEEKGAEALGELEGMFAFAIWDDRDRSLLLARDRTGKKPLSYWHDGDRLVFASEIKAILEHPDVPREMDPEALPYYLTYLYVPAPLSMFRGIRKLPPAHWLRFRDGKVQVQRYWEPVVAPEEVSAEEAAERIHLALSRAVERRLVSDVPLGAFLSGGIDSSIVVGLMAHHMREPVKTFSIGFAEAKYDELAYARAAAEHFRTDHTEFVVEADAVAVLPKLIWHYDEPFADSSAVPTYYVSQKTAEHVKVALSGDGGDECFGGYLRYGVIERAGLAKKFPAFGAALSGVMGLAKRTRSVYRVRRLLKMLDRPVPELYAELMSFFPADEHARLLRDGAAADVASHVRVPFERFDVDPVTAAQYSDLATYLPGDLLAKVDIASMACSLEVRCPFLDREVVELAFRLPGRLKVRRGDLKIALRRAFRGLLPEKILKRGKMGFGVPLPEWFRGPLKPLVEEVILSERARDRGLFRFSEVSRICREHLEGGADYGHQMWILLCLELWFRTYIDAKKPALVSLP